MIGMGLRLGLGRARAAGGGISARTINSVTVGTQSAGALAVTVASDDAVDGDTIYMVIVPTAASAPSSAEVAAGQASGGGAPTASATLVWDDVIPPSFNLPDGIASASYDIYVVIDNGALSNVATAASHFTLDTVLPVLSAVSTTNDAASGLAYSFTSSKTGPYRISAWADNTNPSNALMESGAGSLVTASGTATAGVAVTGTLATGTGTVQPTIYVADAVLNKTHSTRADVTVTGALSESFITSLGGTSTSATKTLNLSAAPSGATIIISTATVGGTPDVITAMTVQGDTATMRRQTSAANQVAEIWEVTLSSAGSAAADIVITRASAVAWGVAAYRVIGTITTRTGGGGTITSSTGAISGNTNTGNGGVAFGVVGSTSIEVPAWTGLTKDADITVGGASRVVTFASALTATAETPRTISCDPTTGLSATGALAVLALS